ncbi:peptidase [Wenjunlia vitaminophila]|uniref:Peptidase n=1 Tax=Wenjunlia vitaminophila TaxID=76728 RepID=A0A0T6LL01_WENVI|nr:hypothetical protein [Wenjunlia vitaminophila]KRV46559.1 peptidase [Wenjunlia vitaminophila]
MTSTLHTTARAMAAVGVLVAAGALAGPAGASPAPAGDAAVHGAATSQAAQEQVSAFWTAERMRQATPLDLSDVSPGDVSPTDVARGAPETVPATPGDVSPQAFPEEGGPWTGGGEVVTTSGRVFFVWDGEPSFCSGNAVTSANHSTVLTAGHCVKLFGNWHTNWVFVPNYHDGQAPFGVWTAARTMATPQWVASEDAIDYDIGAAVVNRLDGRRLTDVVGGQGLRFNSGYGKDVYAFGFPAGHQYDGEKLIYCSGRTTRDTQGTDDHGLLCDMTGGSSGGPWFERFDEATGTGLQSSLTSFSYRGQHETKFGPYFGNVAKKFYHRAQSLHPHAG